MKNVINFMYGIPLQNVPHGLCSSLFEATERFQMEDMKNYIVNSAMKWLASCDASISTSANAEAVVEEKALASEFGQLAERYNVEELLQESAEFIVKHDIQMKEDDLTRKLTTRVLSLLKEALKVSKQKEKNTQDELRNVKEQEQKAEDDVHKMMMFYCNLRLRVVSVGVWYHFTSQHTTN